MTTTALYNPLPVGEDELTVPFAYINQNYVKVYKRLHADGLDQIVFDGTELVAGVDYSWLNAGTIQLVDPADGLTDYLVKRSTPTDPLTTQQPNVLSSSKINLVDRQSLNVGEEAASTADDAALRAEEVALRTLRVPSGETITGLSSAADRANKFLAFDPSGNPLVSAGTGADAALRDDLGSHDRTKGPALLGYKAPGTGSMDEQVLDLLDKMVWVGSKGADPNGVDTSLTAFLRALETGKPVGVERGSYFFGDIGTSQTLLDLSPYGDNLALLTPLGSAEIVTNTTADITHNIMLLKSNNHAKLGKFKFRDTGYNPLVNWRGPNAVVLQGTFTPASWGDVEIEGIYAHNCVTALQMGYLSDNRVRGVHVKQLWSDDCYYGINCQDNGDGLVVDQMIAYQNYRPYFVYGVTNHKINILNRNNRATSGACNIARFPGGKDTSNITINYVGREMAVDIPHFLIDHLDTLGGVIKDVDITMDIESASLYYPARFVNYTGSGGSETAGASSNIVQDIRLRGSCDAQARAIQVVASYADKRVISVNSGRNLAVDQSVRDAFYLNPTTRGSALTAWTGSGSNPDIGNGSLFYNAEDLGGVKLTTISLTFGSTTTPGTGVWGFKLPFTAKAAGVGSAWALDLGTANRVGIATIEAGSDTVSIYSESSATAWGQTAPFTWAYGDRMLATLPVIVA